MSGSGAYLIGARGEPFHLRAAHSPFRRNLGGKSLSFVRQHNHMPSNITKIRPAVSSDLPAIVGLLADDTLGAARERAENPLPESYIRAFEAIDRDSNNELVVAEEADGSVVAVLQLTFTPHIAHQGGWRATIEGVRVASSHRGSGVGRLVFEWAIERARVRGCHLVQLTTDKQRPEAKRFYEKLGFVSSHEGMKLKLARRPESAA